MITLPTQLANFMKGKDLAGLKPFALLYRNKWDSVNNKFALEDTPIDISALIAKPNTLSMTLDVNEVAQYNANNVTLTLEDTKNYFVEGTPNSYFPEGYQVYGSKVVLYYGLNTPINPYPTQVGYTVVGSPTITDGVASNFSNNNYVAVPAFSPANNTWQIATKIKLTDTTTNQVIFSNNYQPNRQMQLSVQNSKLKVYISTNGTSDNLANGVFGTATILADTVYWVKFEFTRNAYIVSYSLNGISWTPDIIINSTATLVSVSNNLFFGRNTHPGFPEPLTDGSIIYLNETYIKVNGEYWFNGAHFFWQNNSTPLFTGVIKELPAHKPDKYQVDLKLVSPLEMLKDIEAKDFSDKVTGETLTYKSTDSDGHRIYWTSGTGVGGFEGVYANGVKLFEGVDYEVEQTNSLGLPAIVTIIKNDYYSSTITADYYKWKTGLTVEQIVAGLVGLAGYDSTTEDIRTVIWNSDVKSQYIPTANMSIGYKQNGLGYDYIGGNPLFWNGGSIGHGDSSFRYNLFPSNFRINFTFITFYYGSSYYYRLGQFDANGNIINGFTLGFLWKNNTLYLWVNKTYNNSTSRVGEALAVRGGQTPITIVKSGTNISFSTPYGTINSTIEFDLNSNTYNEHIYSDTGYYPVLNYYVLTNTDDVSSLDKYGIVFQGNSASATWDNISGSLSNANSQYRLDYRTSNDGSTWSDYSPLSFSQSIGETASYLQAKIQITTLQNTTNLQDIYFYFLASSLTLSYINLSGKTVLEALQDFALISGYEFGVDRQGVFFFRPRVASTNPTYILDHNEIVKVDTVKKNLSDFFTKLTLTFAQVPLEFYANDGPRPNSIDKYGVINKEIDKPDIVNYDNPELAQAIGPQLLEVYSALPNVIQAVGKLNLALELGDIVNLKRNLNLIANPGGSDFNKYRWQQTYYRACKITGMNYNFAKRQITYTLRDVSNSNNMPPIDAYGFPYDLPIQLGKLKTE